MWQKLGKSYPPQLELVPLLLLGLGIYVVWSAYATLPIRIPTHFNIQGVPDGWGNKSALLVQVIMAGAMYLVFSVINILLAVLKDPRVIINLPECRKAALTPARVEELRVFMNRSLFVLKILMLALLTYTLYMSVEVALGRATELGAAFLLILAALLACAGYMVWKSFSITGVPPQPGRRVI